MRSRFAFSVLGLAALTACSGQPMNQKTAAEAATVDLEAARAAIAAANKTFDENYLKGDAAGVATMYTDDAAQHPAGQPTVRGRAAIEARVKAQLDSTTYTASTDTTDELIVAGDYVIEIGTFTSKATFKSGKPSNEGGRWMAVWKRDATGAWKVYRDIANSAPTKP